MAKKTVRFIKPWHLHPQGEICAFDAPIADSLIQCGRAELVEEVKPEPKAAIRPERTHDAYAKHMKRMKDKQ